MILLCWIDDWLKIDDFIDKIINMSMWVMFLLQLVPVIQYSTPGTTVLRHLCTDYTRHCITLCLSLHTVDVLVLLRDPTTTLVYHCPLQYCFAAKSLTLFCTCHHSNTSSLLQSTLESTLCLFFLLCWSIYHTVVNCCGMRKLSRLSGRSRSYPG